MASKSVIDTIIAEAGSNPAGMLAVANAINNRATKWGMTPEQVVSQPGQFAGYSNPGSGSRAAQQIQALRARAASIYDAVAAGSVGDPTGGATDFRTTGSNAQQHLGTGINIAGNTFYPTTSLTSVPSALSVIQSLYGGGPKNEDALSYAAPTPMPPIARDPVPLAPLPVSSQDASNWYSDFTNAFPTVGPSPTPVQTVDVNQYGNVPSVYESSNTPALNTLGNSLASYASKQAWMRPYTSTPTAPYTPPQSLTSTSSWDDPYINMAVQDSTAANAKAQLDSVDSQLSALGEGDVSSYTDPVSPAGVSIASTPAGVGGALPSWVVGAGNIASAGLNAIKAHLPSGGQVNSVLRSVPQIASLMKLFGPPTPDPAIQALATPANLSMQNPLAAAAIKKGQSTYTAPGGGAVPTTTIGGGARQSYGDAANGLGRSLTESMF